MLENHGRLQRGMTEAEVEAVLGCLSGDYTGKKADQLRTADPTKQLSGDKATPPPGPTVSRYWIGDRVAVRVWFHDGKIWWGGVELLNNQEGKSWLDRFRDWLG
jgi:hypothetical protein